MKQAAVIPAQAPDAAMESGDWTVPGMLLARSRRTPGETALWQLAANGQWLGSTWSDYAQAVASLGAALTGLGLARGDRVGIMAASCKEWDYAQLAILAAGGVAVGLDPFGLTEHNREIARRCEFVGLVIGNAALLEKFDASAIEHLRFVICLEPPESPTALAGGPRLTPLAPLLAAPAPSGEAWNQAQADSPATIIFTSGTTGEPKGIVYSHRQMCLAAAAILAAFPNVGEGSRLACWLPLSNLFQRMINISAIGRGAQTWYVSDPREVMRFIKPIAPHLFIGVPRFYEKLYAGIQEAIAQQPAWQQRLVRWAWQVGDRHAGAVRAGVQPGAWSRWQFALADRLALQKLRGALGPNLRFMISGSAPMPVWLLERFDAIGLPVFEAYGISENIIPVALNRPDCFRFGSVGQGLPGCELLLAEDGELLVRGPGVFSGYLGEPSGKQETAALDADGFLATGDFASIDADGFITLVGRKAEIFKTSTGRRIAPASIESHLRQVSAIEHAVVFGARRPQPVALLVLSEAAWQDAAAESFRRLRSQLLAASSPLPAYQRPAGLMITAQPLTIAGGELTANLKLRRHVIEQQNAAALHDLYAHLDAAHGGRFEAWSADRRILFCSP